MALVACLHWQFGALTVRGSPCADVGESCDLDYLGSQGLDGCCDGSVYDVDGNGVRVCRAATSEEVIWAQECSRAAYRPEDTLVADQATIATDIGTFTMAEIGRSNVHIGPGGCLRGMELSLDGGLSCSLDLNADVVGGAIVVTKVTATLDGCDGYIGTDLFVFVNEDVQESIPFTVAFDAVTCDWNGQYEAYCASGVVIEMVPFTYDVREEIPPVTLSLDSSAIAYLGADGMFYPTLDAVAPHASAVALGAGHVLHLDAAELGHAACIFIDGGMYAPTLDVEVTANATTTLTLACGAR